MAKLQRGVYIQRLLRGPICGLSALQFSQKMISLHPCLVSHDVSRTPRAQTVGESTPKEPDLAEIRE